MNKLFIASVLLVLTLVIGACTQKVQSEKKGLPALKISENHRFLIDEKGKPFFWLGDTGWLLFTKLNREEADQYLTDRAAKGFNVIQVMVLHSLNTKNAYGDSALINMNVATPLITDGNTFEDPVQYDYWDHVDFVVDKAAEKGIYIGMVPLWGSNVKSGKVSQTRAVEYSSWLANRYKDRSNIIWLNGGDILGSDSINTWKAMGNTINKVDTTHLITFHPFGRKTSSIWFHNENWLDFNMFQSGHRRYDQDTARTETRYGEDNWRYIADDYQKLPVKPTLDGEPSYEGIPQGLHDTLQPRWNDSDLRRYAYWSSFSGACGFTYGHNSVMQFYTSAPEAGAYGARQPWIESINSPGAAQMKHLKNFMLKYRFQELVPIAGQGEKYDYQPVLKGEKCLLIYTFNGRDVQIHPDLLAGNSFVLSWYSPRNGELISKGNVLVSGTTAFDAPGPIENGNDWVMILEQSN